MNICFMLLIAHDEGGAEFGVDVDVDEFEEDGLLPPHHDCRVSPTFTSRLQPIAAITATAARTEAPNQAHRWMWLLLLRLLLL
jgi:hypothetical protein